MALMATRNRKVNKLEIDWQFIVSEQVLRMMLDGLILTLWITAYSIVGSLIFGIASALGQLSANSAIRAVSITYVTIFRHIPLLVSLFFLYFGLSFVIPPEKAHFIYASGYEERVAIIVISLTAGAFMSEVLRAGIEAITTGQLEAALATGLNRRQAFVSVIFPQIIPIIIPGLTSELMIVLKSSAFAMAIGAQDLTSQAQQLEAETFKGFEAMTVVTIIYLCLTFSIFFVMTGVERIFSYKKRWG